MEIVPAAGALAVSLRAGVPDAFVGHFDGIAVDDWVKTVISRWWEFRVEILCEFHVYRLVSSAAPAQLCT